MGGGPGSRKTEGLRSGKEDRVAGAESQEHRRAREAGAWVPESKLESHLLPTHPCLLGGQDDKPRQDVHSHPERSPPHRPSRRPPLHSGLHVDGGSQRQADPHRPRPPAGPIPPSSSEFLPQWFRPWDHWPRTPLAPDCLTAPGHLPLALQMRPPPPLLPKAVSSRSSRPARPPAQVSEVRVISMTSHTSWLALVVISGGAFTSVHSWALYPSHTLSESEPPGRGLREPTLKQRPQVRSVSPGESETLLYHVYIHTHIYIFNLKILFINIHVIW